MTSLPLFLSLFVASLRNPPCVLYFLRTSFVLAGNQRGCVFASTKDSSRDFNAGGVVDVLRASTPQSSQIDERMGLVT